MADPVFREAVVVSGGALLATIDRLESGRPVAPAKLRRAALAVARHLLRMASRPTPFGLFAGVSVAEFGDTARVTLGEDHRRGVQPDLGWLAELVRRWERTPEVLGTLRVMANNLCFVRGDRLVLPHVRDQHGAQELSVRLSEPVRLVLDLARKPIPHAELLARLEKAAPDAPRDAFARLLTELVEREILLTDLRPPSTTPAPLAYVIDRLDGTGLAELPRLREIAEALDTYAGQPLGHGHAAWRAAVTAMREQQPTDHPPIHVDLRVDAQVRLPAGVATEAERAASVLWRLSLPDTASPQLRAYRDAFRERYGLARVVPVRELVDPETGLGYPTGYRVPASTRVDDPVPLSHSRERQLVVSALVQEAMLAGRDEIVLDDETVDRLATPDGAPPPDLDLAFELVAPSADALDRGEFHLVRAGAAAPSAGAMSGRFAHLFDAHPHFAGHREPQDGVPRVQLVCQPIASRHANVAQVPVVAPRTVAVGTFAESTVDLDEIGVLATAGGLHLVSTRDGVELAVTAPHMLSLRTSTPNLARLLREISASGSRMCQDWAWGDVEVLPYLPRVRYGRTVLALARWLPSAELRDQAMSWPDWCAALDGWRARWRVPDVVRMSDDDHRVTLDLTAPLHRLLLRNELGRRANVVLTESPGGHGWLNGTANEIVVSLDAHGRPPVRVRPEVHRTPERAQPGGDWISAKLYAGAERHDELLSADLPSLLEELPGGAVDRWFFVRYRDPRPHLRLRFHGQADVLNTEVLPRLHRWVAHLRERRLAGDLVLDGYEPEWARYGGAPAMHAAEEVFRADAEAAITQLRLARDGILTVPADLLAAAGCVALLRGFGDRDWPDRLLSTVPKDGRHAAFQACRKEAVELVERTGDWDQLRELAGAELARVWRRRAERMLAYGDLVRKLDAAGELPTSVDDLLASLLHMHHNRFVGMDREREARVLAIARGAVEARRNRTRFADRVCATNNGPVPGESVLQSQ